MTHHISPEFLTIERIGEIIDRNMSLDLSQESIRRIERCRHYLDEKIEHCTEPIYGINTGFGSLCNISIGPDDLSKLQENLVKSHACGIGDLVDPEIVSIMMITKIMSLSFGNSGVQLSTVKRLIDMYNAGVIPVVYRQGSLGASGDLAPLANMCLPLIGLGQVHYNGRILPSSAVLDELGWQPVKLTSKEGLALLNGTQFMSAHAVWSLLKARRLSRLADKIGALSLDVFDGRIEPFGYEVNAVRPHPGQLATALAVSKWLEGSEMISRPKKHVQDPYSFRCMPQVHGATKDAIDYVGHVIEIEINSPTDNPTIFPEEDIIVSAGNFHGQPIAIPMDYLAVALAELASISERRTYKLISGMRELPSFLVANPGLNSGFMIPQYAAASIVNQSKGLCWPTSCDSIPSSQGQEDHVSMGGNSATKLVTIADNTERVLAIELLNAMQALDLRRPLHSSPALESWHKAYRDVIPFVSNDTVMSPLIEKSIEFIRANP